MDNYENMLFVNNKPVDINENTSMETNICVSEEKSHIIISEDKTEAIIKEKYQHTCYNNSLRLMKEKEKKLLTDILYISTKVSGRNLMNARYRTMTTADFPESVRTITLSNIGLYIDNNLPNLKKLTISNFEYCGNNFAKLASLESLTIRNNSNSKYKVSLKNLPQSLKYLVVINADICYNYEGEYTLLNLKEITSYNGSIKIENDINVPNLKTINIMCDVEDRMYNLEKFRFLENLKIKNNGDFEQELKESNLPTSLKNLLITNITFYLKKTHNTLNLEELKANNCRLKMEENIWHRI